jgi:hypothetical protein
MQQTVTTAEPAINGHPAPRNKRDRRARRTSEARRIKAHQRRPWITPEVRSAYAAAVASFAAGFIGEIKKGKQ